MRPADQGLSRTLALTTVNKLETQNIVGSVKIHQTECIKGWRRRRSLALASRGAASRCGQSSAEVSARCGSPSARGQSGPGLFLSGARFVPFLNDT